MADGNDQVAIVRGIDDRVGVGPIGEGHRLAIYVQVIEFIPQPDGLMILIQIDDRVSGYSGSGNIWLCRGRHNKVPVGKKYKNSGVFPRL